MKNAKKRAITDLDMPNGSRDIPFQSQEFEQDGRRHFVGCQPHFHLNITSQMQFYKTMKKIKGSIEPTHGSVCSDVRKLQSIDVLKLQSTKADWNSKCPFQVLAYIYSNLMDISTSYFILQGKA